MQMKYIPSSSNTSNSTGKESIMVFQLCSKCFIGNSTELCCDVEWMVIALQSRSDKFITHFAKDLAQIVVSHREQMSWRSCDPSAHILACIYYSPPPGNPWHIFGDIHTNRGLLNLQSWRKMHSKESWASCKLLVLLWQRCSMKSYWLLTILHIHLFFECQEIGINLCCLFFLEQARMYGTMCGICDPTVTVGLSTLSLVGKLLAKQLRTNLLNWEEFVKWLAH